MHNFKGLEDRIRSELHGFATFPDCGEVVLSGSIFVFALTFSYFLWLLCCLCRCSFDRMTMQGVFTFKGFWVLRYVGERTTNLGVFLTA